MIVSKFQSPKGRLQTSHLKSSSSLWFSFQSPKGRLQTFLINSSKWLYPSFNPQREGYKLTLNLIFSLIRKSFNPQREGYKHSTAQSPWLIASCFNPQREGYKPVDGLRNLTRNKWLSFQAAVGYFYYTPQALESQHIPEITFCCRSPGVFGGITGRQQLVNAKVKIHHKSQST